MRVLYSSAILGTALCLAGCVRYQAKPVSPVATAAAFEQRNLADPGLKHFLQSNLRHELTAWPLPVWDVTNLTLAAFYFSPDLDVARAKWAVANSARLIAGERPNPTFSVAPAYNTTTLTPSPWLVTPTLDIPLETAGKRGYRLAEAGHLAEAGRLNIAAAAWQVRSRVRRSLIDLYAARESERLLREQQDLQAENLRLLDRQLEAGAISAFEVTQARIAADSTRLAVREAERQAAETRVQLADAIGLPVSALDRVELSFADLDRAPADLPGAEARRQALLQRADILSALAEYAASESALRLEIAKQYPDVHLNPGYEFDQGDNKWSVGFTVTLPVLNQNRGAIAQAEAKRAESAANFNVLQARVVGEVDRALAAYRIARQKQGDADALLANLGKQEKAAREMEALGEISKSELLGLRLQLSASALTRLEALTKAKQALAQLEDALQSPAGLSASAWQNPPRAPALNSVK